LHANIDLAYDSHVHFFGVGIPAVQWRIAEAEVKLNLPKHLEQKKIIKGFGWSNKLPLSEFTKLTQSHPDKEFCLSYFDGHSSFISNNLIERLGFKSQNHKILKTGIIIGEVERDQLIKNIPHDNAQELREMALFAQKIFINNEINWVRHLTAREDHWTCLKSLESEGLLKLKIELFFSEFMGQSLDEAMISFNKLKPQTSDLVSASGIKLFYDGAFGSKTAYTSHKNSVLPRCSKKELEDKMKVVFERTKAPLAVHTIGDRALEDVIDLYTKMSKSKDLPTLHLEHAPLFSKKTIELLKVRKLNCIFHFQPSHWINDQLWYAENKSELQEHEIYPFKFLFKHGYPFHFGSDAPVVDCSKDNMIRGLELIEADRSASSI